MRKLVCVCVLAAVLAVPCYADLGVTSVVIDNLQANGFSASYDHVTEQITWSGGAREKTIIGHRPDQLSDSLSGNRLHTLRHVLHTQKENSKTAADRKNNLSYELKDLIHKNLK